MVVLNHFVVCADSSIFCVAVARQHAKIGALCSRGADRRKWRKKKHYTVLSIQPRLVPHPFHPKIHGNGWITDGGEETHARAKEKCA